MIQLFQAGIYPGRRPSLAVNPTNENYRNAVLALGPIAYWRLGDLPGSTVMEDSSGNGRHGTYSGSPTLGEPALITGTTNRAAQFNSGVGGDFASVSDDAALRLTGAATICFWIKDPNAPSHNIVIDKNAVAGPFAFMGYQVKTHPTTGALELRTFDGGSNDILSTTPNVDDGNTHFCVVKWDALGNYTLRVDGVTVHTQAVGSTPGASTGTTLYVSAERGQPFLDAILDEIAIFAAELTDAQDANLYALGTAP